MKMNTATVEVETSGKLEQTKFGIHDTGMMMDHMITTIYSDKIGTIAREIVSNARDAHREVGTPDKPIKIKFPNRFGQTFEIQDWGPGIDPERMLKVFVQLGGSTKRNDNMQTGGFGIGAKTPWCYTDSFVIRTTSIEKDKVMRCRTYSAVKAGTEFTLNEMGDPKVLIKGSDEAVTGTTIIIPVTNQYDWQAFINKTIYYTKFWDVKPELVGVKPTPEYPIAKYHYTGKDWMIGGETHTILVDGIPYPFNPNALNIDYEKDKALYQFVTSSSEAIILKFGVGDLSLSLSREQLQYTPSTNQKIIARLEEVMQHIRDIVEKKVATADNFWNAHLAFQEARYNLRGAFDLIGIPWKGHALYESFNIPSDSSAYTVRDYTRHGHTATGDIKLRTKEGWNLTINKSYKWIIKDEDFLSRLKIVKFFEDNPTIDHVQLISFVGNDGTMKDWKKENNWDLFAPSVLSMSDLVKPPKKPRVRGSTTHTVTKGYYWNLGRFREEPSIDLTNGDGVYVLVNRKDPVGWHGHQLSQCAKLLTGTKIYGIPERFAKHIGTNWKTLKSIVTEKYNDMLTKVDLTMVADYLANCSNVVNRIISSDDITKSLANAIKKKKIKDEACPFVEWFNASEEVKILQAKYDPSNFEALKTLAELSSQTLIITPGVDKVTKLLEEVRKRYPFLFIIVNDYISRREWDDKFLDETIFYINSKN